MNLSDLFTAFEQRPEIAAIFWLARQGLELAGRKYDEDELLDAVIRASQVVARA